MTLEDDEVVRPGPDDSVAPGVVLKLDALPAAQAAPGAAEGPAYLSDRYVPSRWLPLLLSARAFLLGHPALILAAVLVSLGLTIYLAATGRWILALLV